MPSDMHSICIKNIHRQEIRDRYAVIQEQIDAAETVEELKALPIFDNRNT